MFDENTNIPNQSSAEKNSKMEKAEHEKLACKKLKRKILKRMKKLLDLQIQQLEAEMERKKNKSQKSENSFLNGLKDCLKDWSDIIKKAIPKALTAAAVAAVGFFVKGFAGKKSASPA